MKISRIELSNWRSYRKAEFNFNTTSADVNNVIVEGVNGSGKTSIVEAIMLCMYGKHAMHYLARALEKGGRMSHDDFMADVINKELLNNNKTKLSTCVKLAFIDNDGVGTIQLERRWHFSRSAGRHKPREEEFIIRINGKKQTRKVGEARQNWQEEMIANLFLPPNLARFFLFDDALIRYYARMEQAEQVRKALDCLVEFPVLEKLIDDLKNYARKKMHEASSLTTSTMGNSLEVAIEQLAIKVEKINGKIKVLELNKDDIAEARSRLADELALLANTGSDANELKNMSEQLREVVARLNDTEQQLQETMVRNFAHALTEANTIAKAAKKIDDVRLLTTHNTSKKLVEELYKQFINTLRLELENKKITQSVRNNIIKLSSAAWNLVWYPKREAGAAKSLHQHLSASKLKQVKQTLQASLNLSGSSETLLDEIANLSKNHKQIELKILKIKAIVSRAKKIVDKLNALNSAHEAIDEELLRWKDAKQHNDKLINEKTTRRNRLVSIEELARPVMVLAEKASDVATMVDEIIKELIQLKAKHLATRMTGIYKKLSSKKTVQKIDILENFFVVLLNSRGVSLEQNLLSATEEQIFSQSLIFAVILMSERAFPLLIDTSFASLDQHNRKSVIAYMRKLDRQVILLATDTELIDEDYTQSKGKLQMCMS